MPDHAHPPTQHSPVDHARTLVEAFLHLDLTAHGPDLTIHGPDLTTHGPDLTTPDDAPAGMSRQAVLTEEEDAWRVRLRDAEVLVPYASEAEARSARTSPSVRAFPS